MKKFFIKFSSLVFAALVIFSLGFGQTLAQSSLETRRCEKFKGYLGPLAEGLPQFCSATELALWIIDKLLIFSGIISVMFIVIGGFMYIASAGNEEQSEKGKKILMNAIIGLVVIIMAGSIVRIVSGTLTKNDQTSYTSIGRI